MPTSKGFTYTRVPLNLFRNVMKYSNWWKIDWTWFDCIENSANLKQVEHIYQPTAGPVPHACAQPYRPRSKDSCFALMWVYQRNQAVGLMNGGNPRLKNLLLPRWVQSCLSSASSRQHMWELLAGNRTAVLPRNARGRRIMGFLYVCPLL